MTVPLPHTPWPPSVPCVKVSGMTLACAASLELSCVKKQSL
eukprot:SAG11_NODE_16074_length_557_cov_1.541485_1_plen_40_part_10